MKKKNAVSVARNPQATLNELIKSQPEGGEIPLTKFARASGLGNEEALDFLRTATGGCYVEGRRGHKSRFLHGEAFDKFRHQEEIRREWRKKQGLPPNALPTTNGRRSIARVSQKTITGRKVGRPLGSRNTPKTITPAPAPAKTVITREPTNGDHLNVGKFSLEVDINGQKATLPLTLDLVPTA